MPEASKRATLAVARDFVNVATRIAPRDTQRYVAAWAQAGNAAGTGPHPVPMVRASRHAAKYRQALKDQYRHWASLAAALENSGPDGAKRARQAARRRDAAARELMKYGDDSIVIGLQIFTDKKGRDRHVRFGDRALVTVRDKVYGGTGTTQFIDGKWICVLHNREAHASLVERKFNVRKRAAEAGRMAGARQASAQITAALARFAGVDIRESASSMR